jgi:hypothetical protein
MDEKHIEKVKQLLTDWNPLGERAKQITDLGNYETEAIDILFYLDKKIIKSWFKFCQKHSTLKLI